MKTAGHFLGLALVSLIVVGVASSGALSGLPAVGGMFPKKT